MLFCVLNFGLYYILHLRLLIRKHTRIIGKGICEGDTRGRVGRRHLPPEKPGASGASRTAVHLAMLPCSYLYLDLLVRRRVELKRKSSGWTTLSLDDTSTTHLLRIAWTTRAIVDVY